MIFRSLKLVQVLAATLLSLPYFFSAVFAQEAEEKPSLMELSFRDSSKNPYVNVYSKRLEVARLEISKQATIAANERIKWVRMQDLASKGAVSLQQADAQETMWKLAVQKMAIAKAKALKSEALLSIARQRVDAGLEMPLCTSQN